MPHGHGEKLMPTSLPDYSRVTSKTSARRAKRTTEQRSRAWNQRPTRSWFQQPECPIARLNLGGSQCQFWFLWKSRFKLGMLKLRLYVGRVKTYVLHIVVQLLILCDSYPKRHLTKRPEWSCTGACLGQFIAGRFFGFRGAGNWTGTGRSRVRGMAGGVN